MPKKLETKVHLRSLAANNFYSDMEKKDCLYAALIRSPAATGNIKNVTAEDLSENCYLFTSEDIPGEKKMVTNETKCKIFGYNGVSYTGEPVGILLAPSEQQLEKEMEKVSVNFDVSSLEAAVQQVIDKNKRPIIDVKDTASDLSDLVEELNDLPSLDTVIDKTHSEEDPNKIIATREIKFGLYETKTVKEADYELFKEDEDTQIIEETWSQTLINPNWHETDGAFCYTEGEKIHVYTPTKWTHHLQNTLAQTLNIPSSKIYIHKTKSSGIYSNGLCRTNQLAVQAAIASYLTKKPVKLVLPQSEQEAFMAPGVQPKIKYRVAVSKTGKIKALKAEITIDVGAENPFAQEITDRISIAAVNYYKFANLYVSTTTHISKNPPTTIHIKSVDSQVFFAMENMMQKISTQTGLFPDELRNINSEAGKKDDFPIKIDLPYMNQCVEQAVKLSDFNRKYASFHMEAIDRIEKDSKPFFALPLRGIGLSSGYNISNYCGKSNFSFEAKLEVTLTTDNKVVIHALKPSEVIQGIWKSTASEILQIPITNISINSDFDINEFPSNPEDTFSSIGIMNEVVKRCCNEIQKKRFHQPLPISSKKSLSTVLKKTWDNKSFSGIPFHSTASATTVVEVELDTYTYSQKIKGIWITIACGELFDEAAAIKTVRLEVQQELQMLVKGRAVPYDDLHIQFIKSDKKSGQIGELVHNTLPAAFSSALSVALATQLTQLPVTENQIFNLIKNRNKNGGDEE